MDFMTKLERKFGKYAVPNLTVFLILSFIIGYMIEIFGGNMLELIAMNPQKIMQGQVYRLITWILIPPRDISVWVILTLMFYYYIGRTLEDAWGDFRYTVYIVSGILFTDLGIMVTYLIMRMVGMSEIMDVFYQMGWYGASTYYLCMSMFLAYAFMFPERQVLLYFIIPVKVKWIGYMDIAYLIYMVILYGYMQYYAGMITVVMSVLNYILFYYSMKRRTRVSASHKKRKRSYKKEVRSTQILTRHKCAVCGQTEEDGSNLEFRYCSRCKGNYEYCQNHLFTHEHKK